MNFLHLVPKRTYDQKMARERFRWMAAVQEQLLPIGHGVHTTGPGWHDWDETASAAANVDRFVADARREPEAMPHLVVAYQVEGLRGSSVPVAVILQEAYDRPKTLTTVREIDAKLVVFTYQNELPQYRAEFEAEGRTCVAIPHSADDEVFRDYAREKTIDVLIAGNMNQSVYPFRNRLARLAWRTLRKRGYQVKWLPHPGYTLPPKPGTLVGEAYAREVNAAKLVITCTSRYKYALSKLVEIPLCHALPVSDVPAERQGFFRQTQLVVEPWMLDREIQQAMEDLLDDPDRLTHRIKVAREKVEFRLTMKYWAERFIYWSRRQIGEVDMAAPMPAIGPEDAE